MEGKLCYIDIPTKWWGGWHEVCYSTGMKWIIGIDEVGRGPLAGPVYVCAVAISSKKYSTLDWFGINDSKKHTAKNREKWFQKALAWQKNGLVRIALASKSAPMIDKKGISVCISDCIAKLLQDIGEESKDVRVLLDGSLHAPKQYFHQKTIIRGDQTEKIISLASIVAKVSRDAYMVKMSKKHPEYEWNTNKGYGTKAHIIRLKKYGLTPLHRKTFLKRVLDN